MNINKIKELLEELREYMDNKADVIDGDYSESKPNKEMILLNDIDEILNSINHEND